jgi:hypothetical protein
MIFNAMERDYWLLASFTDVWECLEYVNENDKVHWVGLFPDGSLKSPIPVWEADDFLYNYINTSAAETGNKITYIH